MKIGITVVSLLKESRPEGSGTASLSNERRELLPDNSEPDKNILRNEEEINTESEEGKVQKCVA